jgi:geranylgeranyl diphosphate synthase type II
MAQRKSFQQQKLWLIAMIVDLAALKAEIDLRLLRYGEEIIAQNKDFTSKALLEAINYSLSSRAKRIRPMLLLALAHAVRPKMPWHRNSWHAAMAVEFLHCYTLIHDDLPAMDNDDYRRGRLSVHRRFDEGLAILAGDALLADAFFLLSSAGRNAARMSRELARASGRFGLCAGQAEDLAKTKKKPASWRAINKAKTARLFEAAAVLGALSVDASPDEIARAAELGELLGDIFQIKDDMSDSQGLAKGLLPDDLQQLVKLNMSTAKKLGETFSKPDLLLHVIASF